MRQEVASERQVTRDAQESTEATRSFAFAHRVLIATCIVAGVALVLLFVMQCFTASGSRRNWSKTSNGLSCTAPSSIPQSISTATRPCGSGIRWQESSLHCCEKTRVRRTRLESWWRGLGDISITPEVIEELVDGVKAEREPFALSLITEQRDDVLFSLFELKDKHNQLP
jgi:hypothetical protein